MKRFACILIALAAVSCSRGYVTYEQFGAVGDGVHDDMDAIVAAHEAAAEKGLPVRAKDGRTYYIGGGLRTAVIRTDTRWGTARFIIDDAAVRPDTVKGVSAPIFVVAPSREAYHLDGKGQRPRKGQDSLGITLPQRSLLKIVNDSKKVYIRAGGNRNNGFPQQEMLIVDKTGRIEAGCTPVWDYDQLTDITVFPIDTTLLTVSGGVFTTLANKAPARYNYWGRGIWVERSNVRVEGVRHYVEGEDPWQGAPYTSFIYVKEAADVTVADCIFTPHLIYWTKGAAGVPVRMGSYDTGAKSAVNVRWERCSQSIDIDNPQYWGLFGSNFCKNLSMEDCSMSRFDAHMGVANVTLKGCTFGHMGVRCVGFGTFYMEGCEVHYRNLVTLRDDYGSSWEGNMFIKDCVLRPYSGNPICILDGKNPGHHDFGYACTLPGLLYVENLLIDDRGCGASTPSYIFGSFGRNATEQGLEPFGTAGTLALSGVRTLSGKSVALSNNPALFKDYRVVDTDPVSVGKRISAQFLKADPTAYAPEGYDGAKPVGKGNDVRYAVVSLWTHALEFSRLSGDSALEDTLTARFEPFFGEKKHLCNRDNHVDYSIFGAIPLEIAILRGDARARELGLRYADHQWEEPVGKPGEEVGGNGNFPIEVQREYLAKGYTPQTRLWIDDMYMVTVLQSQAFRLTGDAKYIERAAKSMVMYLDTLQRADGLFFHAPDVPYKWGRGNGWMAAGMPMLLGFLADDSPYRQALMDSYLKMMKALLEWQRESGLWGQIIDDEESWEETSGSAMFTYAFLEGVRHGWLDETVYGPAAMKAWAALCGKLDSHANLADVCTGTNRKDSREWYLERPRVNGDPHGQAPMMWICNSMLGMRQ